jgi:hypothetical protein
VYRVVTKLSLHDCMITFVAVLLLLFHLASVFHTLSKSEVKHWVSVLSSSMASFQCIFPKVPNSFNLSMGPDLAMINKHCKLSIWNRLRFDSFWHDKSSVFWVTSSDSSLASYLTPLS